VSAFGAAEWGPKIVSLLQEEYAPLFGLDLGTATASHFDETFRKSFPGSADSVFQKSIAFFLGAAKDGGIIISDRVMHGRKPRTPTSGSPGRARKPKIEKPAKRGAATEEANGQVDENDQPDGWQDRLIAKFPEFKPEWEPAVQAKWFEAFEKLMALRK
jgi:hypothetical protein